MDRREMLKAGMGLAASGAGVGAGMVVESAAKTPELARGAEPGYLFVGKLVGMDLRYAFRMESGEFLEALDEWHTKFCRGHSLVEARNEQVPILVEDEALIESHYGHPIVWEVVPDRNVLCRHMVVAKTAGLAVRHLLSKLIACRESDVIESVSFLGYYYWKGYRT